MTTCPGRCRAAARLVRPAIHLMAAVAALAVLAGTASAPALAASAVTGPGGFGVTPTTGPGGAARSYFSLAIAAGASARDRVIVSNLSWRAERLRVTVSRGVTAANSGSAYEPLTHGCTGAACWVRGLPGVIVVPARRSAILSFRVSVPAGTPSAQYLAGISAEAAARPAPVAVGRHRGARAVIIDQVTVGVAVTVGSPARMRTGVRIRSVTAGWIGSLTRLSIGVRNVGQTFARAAGRMTCHPAGPARSYKVIVDTVLPGTGALVAVNARGLPAGRTPCAIRLRDSAGGPVTWNGVVSVPPRVVTRVYHPAKGVYVALPQSAIPPWAVALLVIGALVLACLVLLLGARFRRPRVRARRAARP